MTFVPFRGDLPSHDDLYSDGFIGEGAVNLPGDAEHGPTGLAEGPDGSLYITDDQVGRIWPVPHASRRDGRP